MLRGMARATERLEVAQVVHPLRSDGTRDDMMDLFAGETVDGADGIPPEPLIPKVRPSLPAEALAFDAERLARKPVLEALHL